MKFKGHKDKMEYEYEQKVLCKICKLEFQDPNEIIPHLHDNHLNHVVMQFQPIIKEHTLVE